ncbi:bifunctional hydroxymethylpyrimidine kinase/phosphomethylpyrimidine kinase [Georgenia sp. SUBG003]|uniref:bifunctional hydroxymethylpyrimidine kinase/phosphomethylpyrimidine kinase n=1 Tax=Georgenia sp. SUBG003 TaxID=1497974 RepID=UPI003AB4CCDD
MVKLAYVIAGSEATGAGIQVDLKTFQQLGVYGVGTTTCIVSFDPRNDWAHRFVPVPPDVISEQIEAATAAHDLDVVKIGMLGTTETIEVVAGTLRNQAWRHVVLDPVLICKGQEPGAACEATWRRYGEAVTGASRESESPYLGECDVGRRYAPQRNWTRPRSERRRDVTPLCAPGRMRCSVRGLHRAVDPCVAAAQRGSPPGAKRQLNTALGVLDRHTDCA